MASLFDPLGQFFAAVSQDLTSHKVQVSSVPKNSSSSLSSSVILEKNCLVNCLEWGQLNTGKSSIESVFLIIGVSDGRILVFSPGENALIDTFKHDLFHYPVKSLHFSLKTNSLWALYDGNRIAEWSLATMSVSKSLTVSLDHQESLVAIKYTTVGDKPQLVLASHRLFMYDLDEQKIVKSVSNHVNPVVQLELRGNLLVTCAAERFANVYDLSQELRPVRVLAAENSIVSVSANEAGVSAVTETGAVEVFYTNLELNGSRISQNAAVKIGDGTRRRKRKSQGGISKTSDAQIQIKRPDISPKIVEQKLQVIRCLTLPQSLVIAWFENVTTAYFDIIPLNSSVEGKIGLTKAKPEVRSVNHENKSHDIAASGLYNESNAYLTSGSNFRDLDLPEDISLAIDQITVDNVDPDETLGEKLMAVNPQARVFKQNGKVQTRAGGVVKGSNIPTTGSLSTVLSQALKSNDHQLLEVALRAKDEEIIKQTVANLDSQVSLLLLAKLSERYTFASSAGASAISYHKQMQLNSWIKWVLVIHGSNLKIENSQNSQLLKNLTSLLTNLGKKSAQLSKIVYLQNKLDVVFDKLSYRRELLVKEDVEEEDVEYFEGVESEEIESDSEEDSEVDGQSLEEDFEGDSDVEVGIDERKEEWGEE